MNPLIVTGMRFSCVGATGLSRLENPHRLVFFMSIEVSFSINFMLLKRMKFLRDLPCQADCGASSLGRHAGMLEMVAARTALLHVCNRGQCDEERTSNMARRSDVTVNFAQHGPHNLFMDILASKSLQKTGQGALS
jgi:hypothetical protein